ncbi:amidohydrolase family protein [Galbitalea soli]|uniref:Amidohydrolase family protein n=1 Tax=Galbitalea soli TaxID=1268042 RepID=A0A7C9TRW2_9MICO|nr:amidohydrolase family protein [Galbitalea soli]NEM91303.1 amidohydrolase family protein [Galbitalea soli]NYJ29992.1 imidazolonepropionase-like amidohydrolase [Galbitalea soli]
MTDRLTGLDVWDGERYLGAATLEWSARGTDAVFDTVETTGAGARGGLTVIPGLIDTHVHLIGYAGAGRPDFLTWPLVTRPEEQVLHGLAHARSGLAAGVTTMRDLSADDVQFSLRRAIDGGIVEGPRLLAHGMVGMTAGHGDLFIPPAFPLRKPTADGPDACRALVRQYARAGADGIKIATSGGVLSVGDKASWRNHTRAEIAAIVDEAHALSMRVAAHAHTAEGIAIALDEGVDSLEHATLMTPELADRAVRAGVTVAPTLLINEVIAAGGAGASAEQAEKAAELVGRRDALLRSAADAGVDFVLGTDANGHHVRFGDQPAEVRRMAEIFGWGAERALAAATSRAAAAIGRGSSLGRIAPGFAADFVVLRGAPWADIRELSVDRIVAVVSRGRVVAGSLEGLSL